MFNIRLPIAASVFLLAGQFSYANVEVTFVESAPKDRFVLTNTSQCVLKDLTVNLDLSRSVGKLIFDTTATGAGVEVFQPFEVKRGSVKLVSSSDVKDGESRLSLSIEKIAANDSVSFTIDVNDTLTQSELGNIRVSGSEMANTSIDVSIQGQQASTGTFNNKGKALVSLSSC